MNPNAPLDKQPGMTQGSRGQKPGWATVRRWTRTISTLAAVGMVGLLYVGNADSDAGGPVGEPSSAQTAASERGAIIMSECIDDGRFAEMQLETNADGIPVIEGLDPDLSPEEAADLLRAIQACVLGQP